MTPERIEELAAEALREADNIILLLTADHNTGPHYVKGFDLAQEYMQDRNRLEAGE